MNGSVFLWSRTIHDDQAADQIDILTGSAGDDWYIYQAGEDRATGISKTEAGEAITEVL